MSVTAPATYHAFDEITGQAEAWQATQAEVHRRAPALRAHWRAKTPQQVIFTGCGSSFFLARTAAAFFQQTLGITAIAVPASDIVLFPEMVLFPGLERQMVTLSRSGETSETIKAVEIFRARGGGNVVNFTCNGDAPLSRAATLTLEVQEAREISLAQTRSFSAMLIAALGYALVAADRSLAGDWARLPDHAAAQINTYHALARRLGEDATINQFYFLGSGPYYGLACEGMLKMKEMSLSHADAFHFLEFRHGPKSMVNKQTLVIGLVSETAARQESAVLEEMRQLGGRVLAITPVPLSREQADNQVALPSGLTDLERAPLHLPVMQLMAYYRSLHNGCDPDKLNNLTMVIKLNLG